MRYAVMAVVALAGCTTPHMAEAPTGPCVVDDALRMRFVGTEFRMAQRNEMQVRANARVARVLRPGDAATMDVRPDRLNIDVDDGGQVSGLRCG